MAKDAAKRYGDICFTHLVKLKYILSLEHTAKISKKSRICQTVTGHVLFYVGIGQ